MEDEVEDLASALFALLTARLEDTAALAAQGQGRAPQLVQHERAQELEAMIRDAHTLARALLRVTMPRQGPVGEVP